MAKKAPPKRPMGRIRGYDMGGPVISNDSIGKSIMGGFMMGIGAGKAINDASQDSSKKQPATGGGGGGSGSGRGSGGAYNSGSFDDTAGQSLARGGKIKHTSGPKIGKDDGLIPAQRGEYVVRKSAVNKLGTRALNTINKGKIPGRTGKR